MVVKCGFSAATGQKGRGYQKSPGDLPLLYQVLFPDIKLTMHVKANDLATQSRNKSKSIAIFISTSGDSDFQKLKEEEVEGYWPLDFVSFAFKIKLEIANLTRSNEKCLMASPAMIKESAQHKLFKLTLVSNHAVKYDLNHSSKQSFSQLSRCNESRVVNKILDLHLLDHTRSFQITRSPQ
ncbi:hypothetical protein T10_11472 [Trichinella papuae]|uniref:Uncharacterized protein n=1 Tax=Trichinella papuae TaxID=268474 RepID=A0A0V1MU91_9BILA|nr:hypothetical protein T10_11472 [Trichinella papuae]